MNENLKAEFMKLAVGEILPIGAEIDHPFVHHDAILELAILGKLTDLMKRSDAPLPVETRTFRHEDFDTAEGPVKVWRRIS